MVLLIILVNIYPTNDTQFVGGLEWSRGLTQQRHEGTLQQTGCKYFQCQALGKMAREDILPISVQPIGQLRCDLKRPLVEADIDAITDILKVML